MKKRPDEKTWAEVLPPEYCKCGHIRALHAGALWDCGMAKSRDGVEGCHCNRFVLESPEQQRNRLVRG